MRFYYRCFLKNSDFFHSKFEYSGVIWDINVILAPCLLRINT